MATKGTNAKIKELKGIKPEKITDEQLKKVQDTVNSLNRSQLEIGSMEIKKHEMMHHIAGLRDGLTHSFVPFRIKLSKRVQRPAKTSPDRNSYRELGRNSRENQVPQRKNFSLVLSNHPLMRETLSKKTAKL